MGADLSGPRTNMVSPPRWATRWRAQAGVKRRL